MVEAHRVGTRDGRRKRRRVVLIVECALLGDTYIHEVQLHVDEAILDDEALSRRVDVPNGQALLHLQDFPRAGTRTHVVLSGADNIVDFIYAVKSQI